MRARQLVLIAAGLIACGGGSEPTTPTPLPPPPPPPPSTTATLSGVIRIRDEVDVPVPGATITVGAVSVTSAPNGTFEARNVPTGATLVRVTAPGFEPAEQVLVIQQGENYLLKSLWRVNQMFETDGFLVYVPSGVTTVRGVFFPLLGGSLDTRPLIRDDLAPYQSFPLSGDVREYRLRIMQLARAHSLAIIATTTRPDATVNLLRALEVVSTMSGRPELANAPVMLHGHSASACPAYDFALRSPERVIGFVITKAAPCLAPDATAAITVPAYLIFGETDPALPDAAARMTVLFEQHRALGAVWALAVERDAGHETVANRNLLFNWMEDVVTRRLPAAITPGTPVQLRLLDAESGWLGDRASQGIAEFACYTGNKLAASWLPSERTARDWQAMVSRSSTTTVTACAP